MAATGSQLGLRLAAVNRGWLGPLELTGRVELARTGGVELDVPPLGRARLRTHRGPLRLSAYVSSVDPSRAEGLLRMPDGTADAEAIRAQLDGVLAGAGREAKRFGAGLAARAVAAALGGAAALSAVALRRPGDIGATTAISAAGLAAVAGLAAATRDTRAWRTPELTGLLERAPLILGDLRTAPQRLGTYRDQLADLLRTSTGVYHRVLELPDAPPADAIKLVHVSDIHLSPLALPLARVLVEQYHADAVVDTGDLVDWGTPAENAFAGQIAELGVPYVYVKGNHDSVGIAAAVAKQPNAVVLDSQIRDVAGLRFAGMFDPRFTPDKTTGDDHAHHRIGEAAREFAKVVDGQNVDVALVHAPAAGRALEGLVPLVLAGDIHRREVRRHGGTTVLVQGTSGGSGLRGVQQEPATPVSLSVLYLDRATRRLWGLDEITLGGIGATEVSLVRRRVAELT